MSIKSLPKVPRISTSLDDSAAFIKALYNTFVEISAAVNAIVTVIHRSDNWEVPTLENQWVDYGLDYAPPGYLLDASGFVHLRGTLKNGIAETVFTLPPGYRPDYIAMAVGITVENKPCRVTIRKGGAVQVPNYNSGYVCVDGITFKAAT